MAESTKIEWTDATVNFWWGCTKVGPGCDHCYAEAWAQRFDESLWGAGVPRRKVKSAMPTLAKLQRGAERWEAKHGRRRRVFLQSMSDLFDKEVPDEWFAEAWSWIGMASRLELQIVTKRVSFVEKRLAGRTWPQHAGLIISVVNQEEADRDIPRLLDLKDRLGIKWVGLSMEPLLGPVDIGPWIPTCYECGASCGLRLAGPPKIERCTECDEECGPETDPVFSEGCPKCSGQLEFVCPDCGHYMVYQHPDTPYIDWVIVGGESGSNARPMHPEWARSLRDQCVAAGVPFLLKQWGEHIAHPAPGATWKDGTPVPADLSPVTYERVGKKAAGRLLDGIEHNGFPQVPA